MLFTMNELAAKKIIEAREALELTQTQAATQLGKLLEQPYSLRQYQKLEAGEFPKFKREIVRQLETLLNIHIYDLVYEQKDTLVVGERVVQLNSRVDRLKRKTEADPDNDGILYVPIAAQAGYSNRYNDPVYLQNLERLNMPGFPYRGDRYRAFDVKGDSMEPTYKEGYHLIAEKIEHDQWYQIANYYIYVIVLESDILVKRLFKKSEQQFVAISDNHEFYPQFLIDVKDIRELWLVKRKIDWEMAPPQKFDITV